MNPSSILETERQFQLNSCEDYEDVHSFVDPFLSQFEKVIKRYVLFHVLFVGSIFIEGAITILFFPFFTQSLLFAFMLALLFFTCFSFFTSRLYFQAQKTEKFHLLKDQYIHACRNVLHYQEGQIEHHMGLANACNKLAAALQGKEYTYYRWFKKFSFIVPTVEKWSCWWHWLDVHKMKELLLTQSVKEHIQMVKSEPTSMEMHAALANVYVMLSGLYLDPRKMEGTEDDRWIPHQEYSTILKEKFRETAKRAVEEFKILSEFAPHDPWVHAQLAYSYHDLQMPEEEISECEKILILRPDDKETLFKLGVLYFQQGQNAKGLKVYEELRNYDRKKSETLIQHYD